MNVYFDTEFTGLHKNTTLISIGCIADDGRQFYMELNDYDKDQCNDWIKENVLAHLDGEPKITGNKQEVASKLREWLSYYKDVQLVSDVCHYDMVLFIDLFGDAFDIPSNVNPACHDINQDIAKLKGISEKEAFDYTRENLIDDVLRYEVCKKHNALWDAKVIRSIYCVMHYGK